MYDSEYRDRFAFFISQGPRGVVGTRGEPGYAGERVNCNCESVNF